MQLNDDVPASPSAGPCMLHKTPSGAHWLRLLTWCICCSHPVHKLCIELACLQSDMCARLVLWQQTKPEQTSNPMLKQHPKGLLRPQHHTLKLLLAAKQ